MNGIMKNLFYSMCPNLISIYVTWNSPYKSYVFEKALWELVSYALISGAWSEIITLAGFVSIN